MELYGSTLTPNVNGVPPQSRLKLGLCVLCFSLAAYVVQAEASQYIQKELDFKNPYFILWVCHSFYIVTFPLDLFLRKLVFGTSLSSSMKSISLQVRNLRYEQDPTYQTSEYNNNLLQFGWVVLYISLSITFGAYMWYAAAGLTSMASLTAIYNTSCFFAYVFSVYGGIEKFCYLKSWSVILSILGVLVITLSGSDAEVNPNSSTEVFGDFLSLLSAIFIGMYEVVYKKYAVSHSQPTAMLATFTLSYVGLVTFAVFWVFFPILHWTGWEVFHLPDFIGFCLIIVNALSGVCYSAGIMIVISMTSPVLASVGVMITIPLTTLVDGIIMNEFPTLKLMAGGALIGAGFIMLIYATSLEENSQAQEEGPLCTGSTPDEVTPII